MGARWLDIFRHPLSSLNCTACERFGFGRLGKRLAAAAGILDGDGGGGIDGLVGPVPTTGGKVEGGLRSVLVAGPKVNAMA